MKIKRDKCGAFSGAKGEQFISVLDQIDAESVLRFKLSGYNTIKRAVKKIIGREMSFLRPADHGCLSLVRQSEGIAVWKRNARLAVRAALEGYCRAAAEGYACSDRRGDLRGGEMHGFGGGVEM